MKNEYIKSFDGSEIYTYLWDEVENPIGIVQIFHGMAEHAGRYDEFARELNKAGYIVFADDHRAHGLTAKDNKLGTYKGENCFLDTVEDEIIFSHYLKKKYNLPLYVFGHSYGSFLLQYYITQTHIYDKAILCGSALMGWSYFISFGRLLVKAQMKKGADEPATFIEKTNYTHYNKAVKKGSWLNTDKAEVDKYYADKLNGFALSNKFYNDYFEGIKLAYKKENRENIDKYKPILIISGSDDPVGHNSKSVRRLDTYFSKKLKIKHVKTIIYSGARHEILNEPNYKGQVYLDVINFIKEK